MNKKVIRFSKLFLPFAILSLLIIAFGVFGLTTRGLNLGLDFQAGLIQEVRIAPAALEISYVGPSTISTETDSSSISLIISGTGVENETRVFLFDDYPTIEEIIQEMNTIAGITAVSLGVESTSPFGLYANSNSSNVLASEPYKLYSLENADLVQINQVRNALVSVEGAVVKSVGEENQNSFQIRVEDDGSDTEISKTMQDAIMQALVTEFGSDNVAILKTDFIGSQFSDTLALQSVILVLGTLALIWIYATIRFKWDFAVGAVLAIIHDALIMITFIVWFNLELNATLIAAILTIIGYSKNDTVVVLDRVRENVKILKIKSFKDVLDISQTEILGRTIITTITTLLAVFALYFFTEGTMKEFALALIVGMLSGVYSTIFIASTFISFARRNWKPSDEEKKTQVVEVQI